MAHEVSFSDFDNFTLLSKQDVIDIIDMFFRGNSTKFYIIGKDTKKNRRGSHTYDQLMGMHIITLSQKDIENSVTRGIVVGGNMTAPDTKTAAVMVLAHELQHANQSLLHSSQEIFYTFKKYYSRPCERDARSFVDNNIDVILKFVGGDRSPSVTNDIMANETPIDVIKEVTELFEGCSDVTDDDIRRELKLFGANNAKNFVKVKKLLLGESIDY